MAVAGAKLVDCWIKAYDNEIRRTQTVNKPFGARLARRVGVEEGQFSRSLPTGKRDFVRGMLTGRWDASASSNDPAFRESAPCAYAAVFEHNINQAYTSASVTDMFSTFKIVMDGCSGSAPESFAAEFNDRSAKDRTYLPDSDAQLGRKYTTIIDTLYIDNFEDALMIMENKLFWGVVTMETADEALQAASVTGSRSGKLVGEDPLTGERACIFKEEFVNLVVPIVGITEAWGFRGNRVTPEVSEKAVEVLTGMERDVGSQGSLEIVRQYSRRIRPVGLKRPAVRTLQTVQQTGKKLGTAPARRFASWPLSRRAKIIKASSAPCKADEFELLDCSWNPAPGACADLSAGKVSDPQFDFEHQEDNDVSEVLKVKARWWSTLLPN